MIGFCRKHAAPHNAGAAAQWRSIWPRTLACNNATALFCLLGCLIALPANAQTRSGSGTAAAANGIARIWVPAGMVGDDYWIYVDGKIVSSPPRTGNHQGFTTAQREDGFDIYGPGGIVLTMRHEYYSKENLFRFIGFSPAQEFDACDLRKGPCPVVEQPRPGLRLFDTYDAQRPPGRYSVQVVIRTAAPARSSFPFVVTGASFAEVQAGKTTDVFVPVPDNWADQSMTAARPVEAFRLCGLRGTPDFQQLNSWKDTLLHDPVVKGLMGAAPDNNVVVLNLPAQQGGTREFSGSEIRRMIEAITDSGLLPTHAEVAECRQRYPGNSQEWVAYDKVITTLNEATIDSFRKLAGELDRHP